jgi:predicted adenylyl cyclase CyaB
MRNIEAKFRLADFAAAERIAATLGYVRRGVLQQRDTFFSVASGKLKLREEPDGAALIYYHRDPRPSVMVSDYEIVPVADAARMRAILADALGVIAEVRKQRILMTRANVRLHLDHVGELGDFGEIEAIVGPQAGESVCRAAVDELLRALNLGTADLIGVSYFELLLQRTR